ncbi:MAG TPA: T9SS type A sorting domain-containing protein [bacterium]|nr:T9SS type A sorting domain-containing protein [bacterium]
MQTRTLSGIALVLTVLSLSGTAQAAITFHREWQWYKADSGRSVAQLTGGGYVISGGVQESTSVFGTVLARTDSLGETTSVRTILHVDMNGGFSCLLPDGGCAVLAESGTKILVRKYNAAGDSAWEYRSTWGSLISTLIPTFDGGCLVAGEITDSDMGAVKLAADGHEQWAHYFHQWPYQSNAHGAVQTRDSGYILCGEADSYSGQNVRLVRLTPGGDTIWTRMYRGLTGPMLNDVREMADSGFLAVGYVYGDSGRNVFYMMRTTSTGDTVWTRHFAPAGAAAQAAAMCVTSDGGFAVVGVADWGDSARAWLVKTNAQGDTAWTAVLPGSGREAGNDVEQTADGGYVIGGSSNAAGGGMLLIKTDSLGYVAYGVAEDKPIASSRIVMSVAPNPAHSIVRIVCSLPGVERNAPGIRLAMYDALGRQVLTLPPSRHSSFVIRTSSFASGIYLLRLVSDRVSTTSKVVIE